MPIHLGPISRRRFLARSLAAGAGLVLIEPLRAAGRQTDPHRFALLADTHIDEDPQRVNHNVNMTAHLERVAAELTALQPRPAGVLINGDCAHLVGLKGDYVQLARLLAPLEEAQLELHLTMGNHDDRGPFYEVLTAMRPGAPPVEGRHLSVLQTPHANWFLLDSLMEVNVTPGLLGERQLAWLAEALDRHSDRPAILVAHHYPQWEGEQGQRWGRNGLRDTEALLEVMEPRKHVKAYLFGHSHRWHLDREAGIHMVNLPAVAYVFREEQPSGWVDARLRPDGLDLELRCLDRTHPAHGEVHRLNWRAD